MTAVKEPLVVNDQLLPYTRPPGMRGLVRFLVYAARHPRDFRAGWRPATNLVANSGVETSASGFRW